jgi:WD40 repeat protein
VRTGKEVRRWDEDRRWVSALAFSPDDKAVAWAVGSGLISVRDATTGKLRQEFRSPTSQLISALAFSPGGTVLASAGHMGDLIRRWDLSTGKELAPLPGHKGGVLALAFSPDGKSLASAGQDKTCRFWDLDSGRERAGFKTRGVAGKYVTFSGDGKALVCVGDGLLFRWDTASGRELAPVPYELDRAGVSHAAISPDGKVLAGATGRGDISLWDAETGKVVYRHPGHTARVRSAAFLPDSRTIVTTGDDRVLRFWDASNGKELRHLDGHQDIAPTPDGKTFASRAADEERTVRLFNTGTGQELRRLAVVKPPRFVRDFVFSPDGKLLAVGGGCGNGGDQVPPLALRDVASGQEVRRFPNPSALAALAFSPDGRRLVTAKYFAAPQSVEAWSVTTGERECAYGEDHTFQPSTVAFSPDGGLLAVGGGGFSYLYLWDTRTGKERWRASQTASQGFAQSVAFSPDGRMLAVGLLSEATVQLLEVATGKERARLEGHRGRVWSVTFSPDGRLLVSAGDDGAPLVWDVVGTMTTLPGSTEKLSAEKLAALGADLAGDDAGKAWRAMRALCVRPQQAESFLQERLRPKEKVGSKWLEERIADLDDDSQEVRNQASLELAALGSTVEPQLRKALAATTSEEVRKRLQQLLAPIEKPGGTAAELRESRAVEVLEYLGTPEARRLLDSLAKGNPEGRLTREARSSIGRLSRRPVVEP